MAFIAGAGATNVDLLYENMPRIPNIGGRNLYRYVFITTWRRTSRNTHKCRPTWHRSKNCDGSLERIFFQNSQRENLKKTRLRLQIFYKGDGIPLNITSAIILENDRSFITYGKGSIEPDEKAKEEFYSIAKGAKICMMSPADLLMFIKTKTEGTIMVLDMGWDDELSFEKYDELLRIADYYTPNQKEALA